MKNAHTSRNIKELTDFLDNYNIKYEIVEDRVVADIVSLDHNDLTSLPESFGNLKCRFLWLESNNLTSLPESFGNLKCEGLWLEGNNLTSLPESFGNLKCTGVCLDYNNLTSLPESFGNLKCKFLYLNYNNLTAESTELLVKMKSEGVDVEY